MRKIYKKIIIIEIINILILNSVTYGTNETINEEVAAWHSDFTTSESTDTKMNEWKTEILKKLKETFGYSENQINEKMASQTKLYITPSGSSKYKIRVRRRRS